MMHLYQRLSTKYIFYICDLLNTPLKDMELKEKEWNKDEEYSIKS